MEPVLDYPQQFFIALGLLLGLLGWRFHARRTQKAQGMNLPRWRRWLTGTLVGITALLLLIAAIEATRFVGISFCLDLWEGQTWCNHEPG